MDFVSARIITGDVARLAGFYERATGVQASWASEDLAGAHDQFRHPRDRQHPHRSAVARRVCTAGRQQHRHH